MSCQYEGICCEEDIKCTTCMHGARSYYVEYHEYPADKWPIVQREIIGDDLRFPSTDGTTTETRLWDNLVIS